MTAENARTSPSLVPASRTAAVGLLAGVLAFLLATPAVVSAQTTERVSVSSGGTQGNDESQELAISADGRFVAFASWASNLVPGDTNSCGYGRFPCKDVFVHDRQTGTTERVSVASDGTQGNDFSTSPSISADGRFVAFVSRASNLVPGDTNLSDDVFVHDRLTGTTERVNVDSAGNQANAWSSGTPSISADGRFVAFHSYASNLVVPGDTYGGDVFVHDRLTGTTERVSVDSAGAPGNNSSGSPSMSADGRFVAFASAATNLVPGDTNVCPYPYYGTFPLCDDVFVHDRQTGTTERVSVDSAGIQGNGHSQQPALSADGRFVAFTSAATNLVPGDTNMCTDYTGATYPCDDVFVHDRQTGTTERVSVDSVGTEGNERSFRPAISADGRYVVFASRASNFVAGDNSGWDVFVRDRQTGTTERVSVDSAGTAGNSTSDYPALSADGRFVAFYSYADNLVPGDTNFRWDVFVRDRGALESVTTTVNFDSPAPSGGPGPLDGVFQGIDFGTGQWAWSGPYDVDSTNNVYFADSTGTSRTFAFSPGPRVLQSLHVYGTSAGTLTLCDDVGQTLSQDVTTGSMQHVTTGWTRPSTTVTVSFTMGWSLGVDDITYTTAP